MATVTATVSTAQVEVRTMTTPYAYGGQTTITTYFLVVTDGNGNTFTAPLTPATT